MDQYTDIALACSRLTTNRYSTSFSLGIKLFNKKYHQPIYAIYGFVRFADEIVDTHHDQDQALLLERFSNDTFDAIRRGYSTNPILQSFQWVVNEYRIDHELIRAFLQSMEMDLTMKQFSPEEFKTYVYGSAEVVGLMCLRVFYPNDDESYDRLTYPARKLGEAFQKINFLRDIKDDYYNRGRIYFPETNFDNFLTHKKLEIEEEIENDFHEAHSGIKELSREVRNGVYLAYRYYRELLEKIRSTPAQEILQRRYRVSDRQKIWLLVKATLRNWAGLIK
ncbi:MAG: phytoene/squalene synthase family protein [Bacteroidales bacterium]|jgi:phytoene/squalene synthetase|nr:phytoene/squalene synthase family protein [Bacteroidales bacterium]MDD2569681.1 phytoene/squalene synthase family protein [Bacteroidales bacterium]MDD2811996.1 phytoene/squalene synthase family protein [Bacteroidales bacterium]MDD3384792.1 phytoene/squalene synthase family protein [Bacteroidales bacterium]MDD3810849.1 phytoene/squalene synthase family protein [Bacteroidales bacterium]